jgi:hypothetical protein
MLLTNLSIRQAGVSSSTTLWFIVGLIVLILLSVILGAWFLNRKSDGPIDPGVPEKDQANQRGCVIVFGGVFAMAGVVALFLLTLWPLYRSYRADAWPTVCGSVITSRLEESHDSEGGNTYRVDIHYRYPVNGKTFYSNQYDSSGTKTYSGIAKAHKQQIVQAHRAGQEVVVHYNPADPSDAMLTTTLPDGTLSFIWFPLLFIGAGVAVMFIRPQGMGTLSLRKPNKARATPLAKAEVDIAAVRRKRAGQAIGIGIFALIWNTFVAVFYFAGDFSWCMLPFALVGLLVIVLTVRATLQIFNPAVSVTFARMPLRPGESTNVTFALVGNLFAVRQLTFTLEGREKVTYRQGTDTKTEEHVAWRIPCYETTKHVDMESGRFTINLPADVMTTFIANNNQFTWHLICHGDVPGRPDIKDEFDVTVLPRDTTKRESH